MSKRHARRITRHQNPSKPRWRKEGRVLQRELAETRRALVACEQQVARSQELFDALRRDTAIDARTGEELVAGVVNELTRLRAAAAPVPA
jgi:hypothetical protein